MARIVWISIPEASKRSGIPRRTLNSRCVAGKIKDAKKIGTEWLLPKTSIEEMPNRSATDYSPGFEFDPGQARQLRKEAGVSPEEAAQELGVSVRTLRRWEANDTRPMAYGAAQRYEALIRSWAEQVGRELDD